jgi:hypothetical protein
VADEVAGLVRDCGIDQVRFKADQEVRLARAGVADEDDALVSGDETTGGQFVQPDLRKARHRPEESILPGFPVAGSDGLTGSPHPHRVWEDGNSWRHYVALGARAQ